uniref:Uncharacterized protein n=1 Tax=Romanomermis culicivorax TaxID=13658 RepID=A0A915I9B3_ROMCU
MFQKAFRYWPANPKEPILVDMVKFSQLREYVWKVSIFRGHSVCGFDVEKINQNKVATLFKRREVDNPLGTQFIRYISFTLMNSQIYIIDTTGLMEKEWGFFTDFYLIDVGPYQYNFIHWAIWDWFAKRGILLEELRYAALEAYYSLLVMFAAIHYGMADYLLMQMQVFDHDRMEPKQINTVALHFYQ